MNEHIGLLWGALGPDDNGNRILNASGNDILANTSRKVGWRSHPQHTISIDGMPAGILLKPDGNPVVFPLEIPGGFAGSPTLYKMSGLWTKFEFEYTAKLMVPGNPKPLSGRDVVESLEVVLDSLRDVLNALQGVNAGVPIVPTWPPFVPRNPRIRVG